MRVENPQFVSIGNGVLIHENVWLSVVAHFPGVTPVLDIGDNVRIGRGCQLSVAGELIIEKNAIIGDFVQIGDTVHPFDVVDRMPALTPPQPVRIGIGAVIGSHVTITPGVTVGAGAYVEHQSVVNGNVEPGTRVAGIPARPVRNDT
jgi:acetyltransferase-like isoleucine patch superfamily enzyme